MAGSGPSMKYKLSTATDMQSPVHIDASDDPDYPCPDDNTFKGDDLFNSIYLDVMFPTLPQLHPMELYNYQCTYHTSFGIHHLKYSTYQSYFQGQNV